MSRTTIMQPKMLAVLARATAWASSGIIGGGRTAVYLLAGGHRTDNQGMDE